MKELWKAVAWFRDAGHLSVSAVLCRLLFPDGTSVCLSVTPEEVQHHFCII